MRLNFDEWMKLDKEQLVSYLINVYKDRDGLKKLRDSLEYAGKLNIGNKNYDMYIKEIK